MRYTHVVVLENAAFKVVKATTFEKHYRGKVKSPKWGTYEECLAFLSHLPNSMVTD